MLQIEKRFVSKELFLQKKKKEFTDLKYLRVFVLPKNGDTSLCKKEIVTSIHKFV